MKIDDVNLRIKPPMDKKDAEKFRKILIKYGDEHSKDGVGYVEGSKELFAVVTSIIDNVLAVQEAIEQTEAVVEELVGENNKVSMHQAKSVAYVQLTGAVASLVERYKEGKIKIS